MSEEDLWNQAPVRGIHPAAELSRLRGELADWKASANRWSKRINFALEMLAKHTGEARIIAEESLRQTANQLALAATPDERSAGPVAPTSMFAVVYDSYADDEVAGIYRERGHAKEKAAELGGMWTVVEWAVRAAPTLDREAPDVIGNLAAALAENGPAPYVASLTAALDREALRAEVSDAINSILRSVVPLSALDNATDRILAAVDRALATQRPSDEAP